MIKDGEFYPIDIVYSQDLVLKNYETINVSWKANGLTYRTCGDSCYKIECVKFIEDSVSVISQNKIKSTLEDFNKTHPDEELDVSCNCHGFTFSFGKFFIQDRYVTPILNDEYELVSDEKRIHLKDFDVVVFYNHNGDILHSARLKFDLFLHKQGLRKFAAVKSIKEILTINEYIGLFPKYYKKKDRNCDGFCLNAIGETPENKFNNERKY